DPPTFRFRARLFGLTGCRALPTPPLLTASTFARPDTERMTGSPTKWLTARIEAYDHLLKTAGEISDCRKNLVFLGCDRLPSLLQHERDGFDVPELDWTVEPHVDLHDLVMVQVDRRRHLVFDQLIRASSRNSNSGMAAAARTPIAPRTTAIFGRSP